MYRFADICSTVNCKYINTPSLLHRVGQQLSRRPHHTLTHKATLIKHRHYYRANEKFAISRRDDLPDSDELISPWKTRWHVESYIFYIIFLSNRWQRKHPQQYFKKSFGYQRITIAALKCFRWFLLVNTRKSRNQIFSLDLDQSILLEYKHYKLEWEGCNNQIAHVFTSYTQFHQSVLN